MCHRAIFLAYCYWCWCLLLLLGLLLSIRLHTFFLDFSRHVGAVRVDALIRKYKLGKLGELQHGLGFKTCSFSNLLRPWMATLQAGGNTASANLPQGRVGSQLFRLRIQRRSLVISECSSLQISLNVELQVRPNVKSILSWGAQCWDIVTRRFLSVPSAVCSSHSHSPSPACVAVQRQPKASQLRSPAMAEPSADPAAYEAGHGGSRSKVMFLLWRRNFGMASLLHFQLTN